MSESEAAPPSLLKLEINTAVDADDDYGHNDGDNADDDDNDNHGVDGDYDGNVNI